MPKINVFKIIDAIILYFDIIIELIFVVFLCFVQFRNYIKIILFLYLSLKKE